MKSVACAIAAFLWLAFSHSGNAQNQHQPMKVSVNIDYVFRPVPLLYVLSFSKNETKPREDRCSFLMLNNLAKAANHPDDKKALECITTSLVINERALYQHQEIIELNTLTTSLKKTLTAADN
jgi:hypothetical protein